MAQARPGIVRVTMSTHGDGGAWTDRPGFDQVAGAVTRLLAMERTPGRAALPPTIIIKYYLVGWLAATGAMTALRPRATEGGSYRVHVSLTRVAMWILSLGVLDRSYAQRVAGSAEDHALLPPRLFEGGYADGTISGRLGARRYRTDASTVRNGVGPMWLLSSGMARAVRIERLAKTSTF